MTALEVNPDIVGLRICMTRRGPAPRSELVALLESKACTVQSKIGRDTNLLLVPERSDEAQQKLGVCEAPWRDCARYSHHDLRCGLHTTRGKDC